MNYFKNIIIKFIPKDLPKPLGRWKIENCNKIINNKIDLSNEDHCGPFGQYALEKIELKKDETKDIYLEKPEIQNNIFFKKN
jgi:hypothetical protein